MANKRVATWGIARVENVKIDESFGVSSRESRIPAKSFTVFRKFTTRQKARCYKQSLRNPDKYKLIDLMNYEIIR